MAYLFHSAPIVCWSDDDEPTWYENQIYLSIENLHWIPSHSPYTNESNLSRPISVCKIVAWFIHHPQIIALVAVPTAQIDFYFTRSNSSSRSISILICDKKDWLTQDGHSPSTHNAAKIFHCIRIGMVHSAARASNSMKHRFFTKCSHVRDGTISTQSIDKQAHTHRTARWPLNVPVQFVCLHLLLPLAHQSQCWIECSNWDGFGFYYVFVGNIILLLFIAICCTKNEKFRVRCGKSLWLFPFPFKVTETKRIWNSNEFSWPTIEWLIYCFSVGCQ